MWLGCECFDKLLCLCYYLWSLECYSLSTAVYFAWLHLIFFIYMQAQEHILTESNELIKSVQVFLNALNELRLCHVMEKSSLRQSKRESTKASAYRITSIWCILNMKFDFFSFMCSLFSLLLFWFTIISAPFCTKRDISFTIATADYCTPGISSGFSKLNGDQ